MTDSPTVILIGGPNGAGKSTVAPLLLDFLGVRTFVNADVIAQGLSAFNADARAFEAGRLLLREVHRLANQRQTFAFETTLASRSFAPWIRKLTQTGYEFVLAYLCVRSPEIAIERVAARIAAGGHSVPEQTIRRRWERSQQNFWNLYQPIADRWYVYDNSDSDGPYPIASGGTNRTERIIDATAWHQLKAIIS